MLMSTTVADLHEVLQVAIGWQDVHLNRFEISGREYEVYRDGGLSFSTDARKSASAILICAASSDLSTNTTSATGG